MIWKLLSAFLFGLSVGIFLWEKWGVSDQYKAYINKIKSKGEGNDQTVIFEPIMDGSESRKEQRAVKKEQRKKEREQKKLDRKQKKS